MIQSLSDHYRLPEDFPCRISVPQLTGEMGFFRFGLHSTCYGQCSSLVSRNFENSLLYDASRDVHYGEREIQLSFDPNQVIENLRHERYMRDLVPRIEAVASLESIRRTYYSLRIILPIWVRRHLQRAYFSDWKSRPFPAWPVDSTVDALHEEFLRLMMRAAGVQRVPFIWFWPDGAPGCLMMTHDVETQVGRDFTGQLIEIDESYGFKASFQVIPESRYEVPESYVRKIRDRGFEFNIHDLNHDGRLYQKREEFLRRAAKINEYGRRYAAKGFRAGAMYRTLEWYDAYEFSYDMSLCSVAHLEPKRGGCCTVFPFFIGKILELPLTTSQDYSVFHILNDYSIALWKEQIDSIRARFGLMSFIAHPDYLKARKAWAVYEMLLDHLRTLVTRENIWAALPGEVDQWWRLRKGLRLVPAGNGWEIAGQGAERARLAFAVLEGDRIRYELPPARVSSGKCS